MGIRGLAVLAVVVALAASPVTSACTPWTSGYGRGSGMSQVPGHPLTILHPLSGGDVIRATPYSLTKTHLAHTNKDLPPNWRGETHVGFQVRGILFGSTTLLRLAGNNPNGPVVVQAKWDRAPLQYTPLQGAPSPMRGACELPNGDVLTWGTRADNTGGWIAQYTFTGQQVWMRQNLTELETIEAGALDCTRGAALAGRDAAGTPRLALITPAGQTLWTIEARALVGDPGTARDLDFQTDGRILLLYEWVAPIVERHDIIVLRADGEAREVSQLVHHGNQFHHFPARIQSRPDQGFLIAGATKVVYPVAEFTHERVSRDAVYYAFDAMGVLHAHSGVSDPRWDLRADAIAEVEGGIYWSYSRDPPGNYVQAGYFRFLRPYGGACLQLDVVNF